MQWIHPLRALQAIFAFIVLALTAYIVASLNQSGNWFSAVNFMLFVGCWTLFLAVPYLAIAPIYFPRIAHHVVMPAVDVITMIFWFAGFIALGAELPPADLCTWSRCKAAQAATVFGSFEWVTFAGISAMSVMQLTGSRRSNSSPKPPGAHLGV